MSDLITAQRKAIQYYKNLLEKETDPIEMLLLDEKIKDMEKNLNEMIRPKVLEL